MANQKQLLNNFKGNQILFYALFAGQAMFGMVILFLLKDEGNAEVVSPYNVIIPGLILAGIMGAYFLNQKQQNNIPTSKSLEEKLEYFKRMNVLKWAVAEAGNLLSLVLAFLFGNMNYVIWFAVGLAAFIMYRPDRQRFINDYQIGEEEKDEI